MDKEKEMSKVVKPLAKGQITIPAEFRERLNIDSDTLLYLQLKGGKIEITPLRVVPQRGVLREYSLEEIEQFLVEDELDEETAAKVRQLLG
ncbi:MAG: AbrB/MazE/SpoVT family DNA-binding domain-containing protein [Chloroflexi bacterium]|nr:AbrB/MazE/SpoVT family DNA-binding domain-containing protein [Chloroflexota bacterium]